MIGNFIADAVKGKSYQNFSKKISEGILMHRFIDDFTDTHPTVRACTALLRNDLQKFAPVALDVYFDYFLAKNFNQFHLQPLDEFTKNAYQLFQNNFEVLPERSQYLLPYMIQQNWLVGYSTIEGIQKTLNGMARRSQYGQVLKGSEQFLIQHEEVLESHFNSFFKELKNRVGEYKNSLL